MLQFLRCQFDGVAILGKYRSRKRIWGGLVYQFQYGFKMLFMVHVYGQNWPKDLLAHAGIHGILR